MSLMDIFVDLQYGNFKIGSFNHLLNIRLDRRDAPLGRAELRRIDIVNQGLNCYCCDVNL